MSVSVQALQEDMDVVSVRKGKSVSDDQLPCEFCKGFFNKRKLSDHSRKCFLKNGEKSSVKISRVLLATARFDGKFSAVRTKILPSIRDTDLSLIIGSDDLLLSLAGVELEKKDASRYHDVTYTLRTAAKTIQSFRTITNDQNMHAVDLVHPSNYDALICAMKKLCGYVNGKNIKNPCLVIKIGYIIRKLAMISKLMYVKEGSSDKIKMSKNMLTLYADDYTNYSNNARVLNELKKGNVPEELPLEEDMNRLRQYLVVEIERLSSKESLSEDDMHNLLKLVYIRLLVFNARRGGEPGKVTINHWKGALEDIWKRKSDLQNLTDAVERKLAERLKICYVQGKRKRKGKIFVVLQMVF